MKLHRSAVEKLIQLYQNHGGFDSETRLRSFIEQLEFVAYEQKTTGNTILVLAEDYAKQLSAKK